MDAFTDTLIKSKKSSDSQNKEVERKNKEIKKDILSALSCWRMSINSQTLKMTDKYFSPIQIIDDLDEITGTRINLTDSDTQDEFILELLLQNINLKKEYLASIKIENEGPVASNSLPFKTKKLKYILESLNECLPIDNGNYLEIGGIVGEKQFHTKYIIVLVKRSSDRQQVVYEFIFLHSDVEFPSKIECKQKSIQLSKFAHEIKNIILVITNTCNQLFHDCLESLEDGSYAHEEIKQPECFSIKKSKIETESLHYISSLSDYLLFLIEDLNVFTKMENKIPPSNLNSNNSHSELMPALNFCLDIFKNRQKFDSNKSKLKIESKFECLRNIKIKVNNTRLKQILINLLSNAYKFTASGEISLGATYLSYTEETKKIRISVTDTGTGISDLEQKSLLNPFTTLESNQNLNSHGSGLGLCIVKEFLQQAGSNLECSSKRNEGSVFWFDIECYRENIEVNSDESVSSSSSYEKTVILTNHNIPSAYACRLHDRVNSESNASSFESKDLKFYIKKNFRNIIPSPISSKISDSNREELSNDGDKTILIKKKYSKFKIDLIEQSEDSDEIIIKEHNEVKINNFSEDKMLNLLKTERSKSSHLPSLDRIYRNPTSDPFFFSVGRKTYQNEISVNDDHKPNYSSSGKKYKNIIICDDEKSILNAASNILKKISRKKKLDIHIITCCNGIECLNAIYQAYINKEYIDYVFIDENMPFIRGSLTANVIKTMAREKQINDILIYLVSSHDDLDDFDCKFPNCFDGIIPKPIKLSGLENIL